MPKSRTQDEAVFQTSLDTLSGDQGIRYLFAQWLEERGDWRAPGTKWLADHGKWPDLDSTSRGDGRSWDWWSMLPDWGSGSGANHSVHDRVEPAVMNGLSDYMHKSDWAGDCAYCEFASRTRAEEAVIRALEELGQLSSG